MERLIEQNLHIHTTYSPCAKPEMIASDIVNKAVKDGIRVIALLDHYNSEDFPILDTNRELKPKGKNAARISKFCNASELSAYGVGKFLDAPVINEALDYRHSMAAVSTSQYLERLKQLLN